VPKVGVYIKRETPTLSQIPETRTPRDSDSDCMPLGFYQLVQK